MSIRLSKCIELETADKPDSRFVLRRYCNFGDILDILKEKRIKLWNTAKWDDKNDLYLMKKYIERKNWKQVFAFCSTKTKKEHYHHWKRYANDSKKDNMKVGVCIVFDRIEIRKAAVSAGFRCGYIEYKTLTDLLDEPLPKLRKLPFLKRAAFSDEREFRILKGSKDKFREYDTMDINLKWIAKIRLSPWLTRQQAYPLVKELSTIDGCQDIDIGHSTLLQSQRWKKFADQVAANR